MTLTELRYVVALARERHFGRAAASCFVSQPTLSIAVRKFEEKLGVQFFEREPELILTDMGQKLLGQATYILEQAELLKQMAASANHQLDIPLKLGVIFTISPYLLPHLIPALHTHTPSMPLILEENYTEKLLDMLRHGEIDAAVLAEPFHSAGLQTEVLYDEDFMLAAPVTHPWADRDSIDPSELVSEELLLLSHGNCLRDQILALCENNKHEDKNNEKTTWRRGLQGSSLTTVRHMVASGLGVTVLPASAVYNEESSCLAIIPFTDPSPSRRIVLAWRPQFPRTQAIEHLAQAIRECGLPGARPMAKAP